LIIRSWADVAGNLRKMRVELADPVRYYLDLGGTAVPLNPLLGHTLRLAYSGTIHCHHCGRHTRKSFNQGYCWPCFKALAACDLCIVSPDRCHFDAGTCREPEWAEAHCHQPHVVYLANSSGLKVGITRGTQLPTRWIDQGAAQAVPMLSVATRQQAGLAEVIFKQHVTDRTNWRAMLKGEAAPLELLAEREQLLSLCADELAALQARFPEQVVTSPVATVQGIRFPVLEYPEKVKSLDFDKQSVVEGRLLGIKGQYLLLDSGVINLRKFGGYHITLSAQLDGEPAPAESPAAQVEAPAAQVEAPAAQTELQL
jgi:hypothetical protein